MRDYVGYWFRKGMDMKKLLVIAAAFAFVLSLVACGPAGTLGVDSDDTGVHAVAEGSAEGSATGNITIEEGYGLCINHIVNKGTFHVTATNSGTKEVVFDDDITDNMANLVDVVPGDYDIVISAENATGTIDIIPYDKEAQAQADASLDDALVTATGKDATELGISSSSSSK